MSKVYLVIPDLCWKGHPPPWDLLGQRLRKGICQEGQFPEGGSALMAVSSWPGSTLGLLKGSSVAVLAAGVARDSIQSAAAAPTGVPNASGAPSWPFGNPANLCVADGTTDPVTAVLLLYHNLALRAVHGLTLLQHQLEHLCSLSGSHVVLGPQGKVILVFLTVHVLMNSLAEQAVNTSTHGAGELVDIVLKEAPAPAVVGLAVIAEGTSVLSDGDSQVQETLVVLGAQERSDLSFLQLARAGVSVIDVGAGHLGLLAIQDGALKAVLAEGMQTLSKDNSLARPQAQVADRALHCLRAQH